MLQYEAYGYSAFTQTLISPVFLNSLYIYLCVDGAQTFIALSYTCFMVLCVCVPTKKAMKFLKRYQHPHKYRNEFAEFEHLIPVGVIFPHSSFFFFFSLFLSFHCFNMFLLHYFCDIILSLRSPMIPYILFCFYLHLRSRFCTLMFPNASTKGCAPIMQFIFSLLLIYVRPDVHTH